MNESAVRIHRFVDGDEFVPCCLRVLMINFKQTPRTLDRSYSLHSWCCLTLKTSSYDANCISQSLKISNCKRASRFHPLGGMHTTFYQMLDTVDSKGRCSIALSVRCLSL